MSARGATRPVVVRVDDPADPRLAEYLELTDPAARARRERDEFFMVEGAIAIERLLASTYRVRSLLLTDGKLERLATALDGVDTTVYVAPKAVMSDTVGYRLHRGAMAVADRRPLPSLAALLPTVSSIAVLEGLNDPENLGAIARSARAFGIEALVLDPTCIDPYYRRIVRVSMGEILFLPAARATEWPADLDVLHGHGFTTWAMTPASDAADLWQLDHPERLALVLGAEGPGLRPDTAARCTRRVRIPIAAEVDSLNVGAAAAVSFAERARHRSGGSSRPRPSPDVRVADRP